MKLGRPVRLGLVGHPLGHSFSAAYFKKKFQNEGLPDFEYVNFDFADLASGVLQLKSDSSCLGFNVTIPYKRQIIGFLDHLSPEAAAIGAVNTVKIGPDGRWIGYNTDYIGFYESLKAFCTESEKPETLVLGNGGASQAVQYALSRYSWPYRLLCRNPQTASGSPFGPIETFSYNRLPPQIIAQSHLIVNTTRLGMFPDTETCPDIPYAGISNRHYVFDLVYNPEETTFMKRCAQQGAKVVNGLEMLHLQAEAAWKIWMT